MEGNFVDIWRGCLSIEADIIAEKMDALSESEKQKADNFKLPIMRRRYIAVRYLLRKILAAYLQTEPRALQFQADAYGKPFLVCGSLHFNISHTADLLMVAVANFADIGIDVEAIKPRGNLDGLAARCFAETEYQAWRQLPEAQQEAVFYRLWTKKEAFVKAVGRGIALGLDKCEVELAPDGQLISVPAEFGAASAWRVTELPISADSAAALVTPNCRFTLRHTCFEPLWNFPSVRLCAD